MRRVFSRTRTRPSTARAARVIPRRWPEPRRQTFWLRKRTTKTCPSIHDHTLAPAAANARDSVMILLQVHLVTTFTFSRWSIFIVFSEHQLRVPGRARSEALTKPSNRSKRRAGKLSTRAYDSRLLGIPRSWGIIASPNPCTKKFQLVTRSLWIRKNCKPQSLHEEVSTGYRVRMDQEECTLIPSM